MGIAKKGKDKGNKLGLNKHSGKVTPPYALAAEKSNLERIDKEIKTHFGGADCAITRSRNTTEKECCPQTNLISSITNCGKFMAEIAETYTFCKWLATEDGTATASCDARLNARAAVRNTDLKVIQAKASSPGEKVEAERRTKYDRTRLKCYGITNESEENWDAPAHYFAVLMDDNNEKAYIYNAYGSDFISNPGTSCSIPGSELNDYIATFNDKNKCPREQVFTKLFASNPVNFVCNEDDTSVSAGEAYKEWTDFIYPRYPGLKIIELHNYQSAIETIFKNSIYGPLGGGANQGGGRKPKRKSKRKRRTRRTRRRKRTKTRRRRKK
jgi:hypothetical protein